MEQSAAYVRWYEEEVGSGETKRRVKAAWLVRDVAAEGGIRQQVLAYLGQRPAVTANLEEEVAALYPDLAVDWGDVRQKLAGDLGITNVRALTDDELALRLRSICEERGVTLVDLSFRLGYRERQVLPEVLQFLADSASVARFERTSGSIFDYMMEKHPDFAYLIYKARLFLEGEEEALTSLIRSEPSGFGDAAWRARRQFWRERLEAYRRRRLAPEPDGDSA